MRCTKLLFCSFLLCFLFSNCNQRSGTPRVLVFTKAKGYVHASIPAGVQAIVKLGEQHHFEVDTTSDASRFTEDNLKKYAALIFISTTGNLLNGDQKVQLQRYMEAGGGFVGIHAAADAEYSWPWYNKLVGAYFLSHPQDPNVRKASIIVTDTSSPATKGLPHIWERTDEWYNYRNIDPSIKVLAKLDEESYEGGENGANHPIAWYHAFDGGRSFYTGGGHTEESYSEPLFLQHLAGGIQYAIGDNAPLDYSRAYAVKAPEENRFTKVILSNDLNEPMELAVTHDGRVFFVERSGGFYMYDPLTQKTKTVYRLPIYQDKKDESFGNGVLGMTIDPDFDKNNYVYIYYTPDKLPTRQSLSRFRIIGRDSLDFSSEKVILEVPIDPEVSAHTGGSIAWDKDKNLFLSTGDNTVPFASDGYSPIDETPGRKVYDAQRSAGNTNDLRGKVLRIHPEADGSYTIPAGNLFPKGEAGTRPEIYTMGCRNPYRISVDQATSVLYWGEVGPDAGEDGAKGPRGYDEFNQAKKAGNYGWPYFVGDSKAYPRYDFVTKKIGEPFNPEAPENNSIYNTGLKTLPPVTNPLIWYPYGWYDSFPDLGEGGRCAIAGPVYHYDKNHHNKKGLPEYYDKALFIADWMRNWIFAVRLNDSLGYKRMEAFMPLTGNFKRPIDFDITPDGVMYMLEYGSVYGADNVDARLVRLEFNGGNRAPVAAISVSDSLGLAPLKVNFDAGGSVDYDEDDVLSYHWDFGDGSAPSEGLNPEHQFTKNGIYKVTLTVTDPSGEKSSCTTKIEVGNTAPQVSVNVTGNSSFYFAGQQLQYTTAAADKEDKAINPQKLAVSLKYLPREAASYPMLSRQQSGSPIISPGRSLINTSDCAACHQFNAKSAGPAFLEVSKRYTGKPGIVDTLVKKIISGGSGNWGQHEMSAHPQLSPENVTTIVHYILSLSGEKTQDHLPAKGSIALNGTGGRNAGGCYILAASYTDDGNGVAPLTGNASLVLRPSRVEAEDADRLYNIDRHRDELGSIDNKSWFVLKNIDLEGIKQITYRYSAEKEGATI
ncbi:MAG TPA: ThuA domain-containing protein, partial [Puia sp.]|nr:ThuA domain-containing protein [Puia sp.]